MLFRHSKINIVQFFNTLKKDDNIIHLNLPCALKYDSKQTALNDRILGI
jgi:hypothetical protein